MASTSPISTQFSPSGLGPLAELPGEVVSALSNPSPSTPNGHANRVEDSIHFERIRSHYHGVDTRNPNTFKISCPVPGHADRHPSCDVTLKDGKILVHCQSGNHEPGAEIEAMKADGVWPSGPTMASRERVYEYRFADGKLFGPKTRYDHADGSKSFALPKGTKIRDMPLLGSDQVAKRPHDDVYYVEGEEAAKACMKEGLLAVTAAGGADQREFGASLEVLKGHRVNLWADKDDKGRALMAYVATKLRALGIECHYVVSSIPLPHKGDAVDYFTAGGTVEQLRVADTLDVEPTKQEEQLIKLGRELFEKTWPDVDFVIPGIAPDGTILFCSKPKIGKTWFVLDVAIGLTAGGYILGQFHVEKPCPVLLLALEDGDRRLHARLSQLLDGTPVSDQLYYATEFPRLNEGGYELLDEWLTEHPDARAVVIDSLKKVKPNGRSGATLYDQDYEALETLTSLSHKHSVAIFVVYHLRKTPSIDDPFDEISGSTGLQAAVDTLVVIKRPRGRCDGALHVTGRDIMDDQALAVAFDQGTGRWSIGGPLEQHVQSQERQEIVDLLSSGPPGGITPKEIAEALGKPHQSIKTMLSRMRTAGQVASVKGKYSVAEVSV